MWTRGAKRWIIFVTDVDGVMPERTVMALNQLTEYYKLYKISYTQTGFFYSKKKKHPNPLRSLLKSGSSESYTRGYVAPSSDYKLKCVFRTKLLKKDRV